MRNAAAKIAFRAVMLLAGASIAWTYMLMPSHARDLGQWENNDPVRSAWFKKQVMPDQPLTSCCGEADAYYADGFEEKHGNFYAKITDDRDDKKLKRAHVDVGTKVYIPPNKFNKAIDGNPTGHGIVFLRPIANGAFIVYCYFTPALV